MKGKKKHKVETELHLFDNGERARVTISVSVDAYGCGSLTVVSGPSKDVKDFYDGKMTLEEITMKWAHDK